MPVMTNCVWYISDFCRPWEAAVIDGLAAVLNAKGLPPLSLQVYVGGGTANFHAGCAMSWRSLTFFEKLAAVLFRGKLWHLWGKAPFWWGLVRLRARTVHTSLDDAPEWRGHPTRLFEEQARHGESLISPAFEAKVVWSGKKDEGEESSSAVILAGQPGAALREALEESKMTGIPLTGAVTDSTLQRGRVLFAGETPSDALLAAYLTAQGIPVLAAAEAPDAPSAFLSAVLGRGGYIVPRTDDKEGWKAALGEAASEAGRAAAASARRFLKDRYETADAVKSVETLYRTVMGGKFR
ncbi:MAG: hypothetical protein LBR71_00300 [Synergistaceae bacterium]|jgi:hypothetical protein|nr:hypothetical protein [Synergistaceae bacterium]